MKSFLIIIFSICYSLNLNQWNNITSTLSPSNLIEDNGILYGATPGGVFQYDIENQDFHHTLPLDYCDTLVKIESGSNGLWHLCENGVLYNDGNSNLIINHLDIDRALDFIIYSNNLIINDEDSEPDRIFVLYEKDNMSGIVELTFNQNSIQFIDNYSGFTQNNSSFISITRYSSNSLLLLTEEGLYAANISSNNNLNFASNWHYLYQVDGALDIILPPLSYINQNDVWLIFNDSISAFNVPDQQVTGTIDLEIGDYIDFYVGRFTYILGTEKLIKVSSGPNLQTGSEYEYDFENATCILAPYNNGIVYVGIKDQAFWAIDVDISPGDVVKCSPNSLLTNDIHAITYNDGFLYGVGKDGIFIGRNLYDNWRTFINLLATPDLEENDYGEWVTPPISYLSFDNTSECNFFNGIQLDYISGDNLSPSIVFHDNKLYLANSGIRPNSNSNKGGVVIIDTENFIVDAVIDTLELDGLGGIYFEDIDNSYITINQVKADNYGKIWVVNPYPEHTGNILAYYDTKNDSWNHIQAPDETSYLPQEIAFDNWGRTWVSFRHEMTIDGENIYSNGGLKLLTPSGAWRDIDNLESLPGNDPNASVWSIDFGKFGGNDILWVLSSNGVQGYSINGERINPISQFNFFSNISFFKGDKIRVDAQNNVWITTSNDGVKVIKNDFSLWPTAEGFTTDNSQILSNTIRDIAFDSENGIAFIATNAGLSMLGIPFTNTQDNLNIGVTPNPFIIGGKFESVLIDNIRSSSTIKIMTLFGMVVKKIEVPSGENRVLWDGREENGNFVDSGVYLIVSENDEYGNGIAKLAIIR